MSRSVRKVATIHLWYSKCVWFEKKQSNKRVRKTKSIPNGKSYKKIYDTWNIREYDRNIYNKVHVQDYIDI